MKNQDSHDLPVHINQFTLSFLSKDEEMLYIKSLKIHHSVCVNLMLIAWACISTYGNLIGNLSSEFSFITNGLPIVCILIAVLFIFFLVKWEQILNKELLICLIVLANVIVPCELDKQKWSASVFFCFGNSIQLFNCFLTMTRVRFKICIFFNVFLQLYPILRMGSIYEMQENAFYPLGMNALILLLLLGFEYLVEKHDRLSFHQSLHRQETLENFRDLISRVMPTALMIIKNKEVIFSNSYCKTLLNLSDSQFTKEEIKEIFLEEDDLKSMNLRPGNGEIQLTGVPAKLVDKIEELENNNYPETSFLNLSGFIKNEECYSETYVDFGNKIPLDIQLGCVAWENSQAVMVILSDGSAKKRIKTLKELDKYKDRLLATVSHDLRTPLNGIIGMVEASLLACESKKEASKELKKLLSLSKKSANILSFMINDILDFSQILEGKLRLNRRIIDIISCIKDLIKIMKFQTRKKGLELLYENLTNQKEVNLLTDPNRLKQILLNLIGNSIKFTSKGFIKITIEFGKIAQTSVVLITVSDSGIGIKKEDLPRLFKHFGKLEQQDKELNPMGIGLGLAISQDLVEMLSNYKKGGEIVVSSQEGIGSHFSFPLFIEEDSSQNNFKSSSVEGELESEQVTASANQMPSLFIKSYKSVGENEAKKKANAKPLIENNGNANILIVDDDYINILVISKYLESLSQFNYKTASNGKEALEIITSFHKEEINFDILFIDCNMPIMDGYECASILRKMVQSGDIPDLYIVALSGYREEENIERCYAAGINYYLTKPINKNEFESIVNKLVRKSLEQIL